MSQLRFDQAYALKYDIIHPWHRENVVKYFKEEKDLQAFITDNKIEVRNTYPMNKIQIHRVTLLQHGSEYFDLGTPIKLE